MSDAWNDTDLDDILGDVQDNSTIKVLREKIKADNAAMRQMRTELDSLRTTQREKIVEGTLRSAGFKSGAASLYSGDPDPTAVQAWVEANKDFLAREDGTPQVQMTVQPQEIAGTPAQGTAPAVFTPDTQAAYARMISAGVDGVPPSNFTDALGSLQGAKSIEELMQAIQTYS